MFEYSALGIQKITEQANRALNLIRCPLDGVVMRIVSCRAERMGGSAVATQAFTRLPRGAAWRVTDLDVECPACRRHAEGIVVTEGPTTPRSPRALRVGSR